MECKSIVQSSSSSPSTTWKYDVFVSFRGEDIRNNFADHLFAAFQRKGIVVFRDDRSIKHGDHISTELMQAIEGSQVLTVIFSKNYATSSWCLHELAKIVDCMKVRGQIVLPVFYDVSPSEVRKQSGNYGEAFAELEERFEQDQVQQWRKALQQVADLCGCDVQKKPQHKEIENIVKRVINIVGYKLSSLDGLVGMHPRVEQLEKLLKLDFNEDVRVIGICGMGGIGKTTLARAVYDKHSHQYGACFIDDISKVYRDYGVIGAQKQLIYETLNEENQEIWSVANATYLIKTRLPHVKAFIVLDNVDEIEQLENLGVNREYLCAGSRIIVISRDRQILNNYGMDEVYDTQLLNMDEARQLFCSKAFKCNHIMSCDDISREYEVLVDLALEYAQFLPLAIKVLGSFLCDKSISEWRSALARLRDNPTKKIMDVLQISFDGLEPIEKEIFLDIACFFNKDNMEFVKKILDYRGFHPDIGIKVLIDKSLITVSGEFFEIHDLLRELGMKIVRQNAPNDPGKWSRVWCLEDFHMIMFEEEGMDSIEAIKLLYRNLSSEPTLRAQPTLRADALSKMNRLKLLIVEFGDISGSLNYLSSELRYLYWSGYSFPYFPSNCELNKLVELILPYSTLKQLWKGKMALYNLKVMDLRNSRNLVKTPDLSGVPNLEQLILKGCKKLVQIDPSIGLLRKLVHLNLENCTSLTSLPNSIFGVSSLQVVNLRGCSKLFNSKQLENERHNTSDSAIQCQSTFSFFKRLKLMLPFNSSNARRHNDIDGSVTHSLARFCCLRELDLSYCNIMNIPDALAKASLYCLEILNLRENNFVTLPCSLKELPRLRWLMLDGCKQLECLPEFPLRTDLPIQRLQRDHFHCDWGDAVGVSFFNCSKLAAVMEGCSGITFSWMIKLLKVLKESSPCIAVIFPGTEIPSWFNTNLSVAGHSAIIEPFPDMHDNNWIGIAICATFIFQCDEPCSSDEIQHVKFDCSIFKNGISSYYCQGVAESDGVPVGSAHLCLFYINRHEVNKVVHNSKDIHVPLYFGFLCAIDHVHNHSHSMHNHRISLEMKKCGMRVVYKQDLEEEFNGDK